MWVSWSRLDASTAAKAAQSRARPEAQRDGEKFARAAVQPCGTPCSLGVEEMQKLHSTLDARSSDSKSQSQSPCIAFFFLCLRSIVSWSGVSGSTWIRQGHGVFSSEVLSTSLLPARLDASSATSEAGSARQRESDQSVPPPDLSESSSLAACSIVSWQPILSAVSAQGICRSVCFARVLFCLARGNGFAGIQGRDGPPPQSWR